MKDKLLFTLRPAAALLPPALGAQDTNRWHVDASLNLFMAGISGDVTARGIPAKVDASFGDILENLEAGAAGRFTVHF